MTALATCAFLIVSASKVLPTIFASTSSTPVYSALPLSDLSPSNPSDEQLVKNGDLPPHQGRVRITILAGAITAVSVRLELYRQISKKPECGVSSVEVYLPLILAVHDALRYQRHEGIVPHEDSDDSGFDTLYGSLKTSALRVMIKSRYRYILPAVLLCYGSHLLLGEWMPLNSTFICPVVLGEYTTTFYLQLFGLVLDSVIIVIIYEMLPRSDGSGLSPRRSVVLWSSTLAATALIWSAISLIVYIGKPQFRFWILLLDAPNFFEMISSISVQSVLFSVFTIATLHSIMAYGTLAMAFLLTLMPIAVSSVAFIWTTHQPYPPASAILATFAFILIYLGWWTLHKLQHLLGVSERGPSRPGTILALAFILLFPAWIKKSQIYFHPIDLLIYEADRQYEAYFNTTQLPHDLAATVSRYKQRYGRNPPPAFEVWWEFATNRSTMAIDEYDQIDDDILPFYSVSPADIRRQTWEMVSNPWNEVSGITVRDGVATVQENVLPTHRWMLEGVAVLINSFAQHLPDMDLAFNLNDESRVAVPYNDLNNFRSQSKAIDLSGTQSFSTNRKDGWLPIPDEEYRETIFRDLSFRNTFNRYGSVGCPPSSPARCSPYFSSQASVCLSCTKPHSLGQFLANWTTAANICHQPDMAHLHGFYLSPAAFKASHALVPVFSQSKPHGYNDILYPSAWNYMDKVIYAPTDKSSGEPGGDSWRPAYPDPTFYEKANTLFWRGATSEGVSSGDHTWRGMTRQRLVHLTNNLTAHPHDTQTILLPDPKDPRRYKYTLVPGDKIADLHLDTDIAIVDHIARCGGIGLHDCTDQANEFNLVAPTDFQSHWQYRYLFDLDGAGFSGRFLPFLQSRSVPFKSALFREWYDSRITAWKHFVPLDSRLHGVYSTLAYFAGVEGKMPNGKVVNWAGHIKEAERIAEEGRKWAGKVLRKEDMEVYFFRLLLEWGRVTDDNREKLGFDVPMTEVEAGTGDRNQ